MTSHVPERLASTAALIVALALAAACGSSNPTSPGSTPAVSTSSTTSPGTGPTPSSGTGTLRVMLRDSPFSDASAVLVSFKGVSVHMSGGDWQPLTIEGQPVVLTCDLKKLQGPQALLGTAVLTAGHYTQIRLMVDSARIYQGGTVPTTPTPCAADAATLTPLANGDPNFRSPDLIVPSGEIKLNREFDLAAGGTTVIGLDFDGEKSITQTGNGKYMMKPVIGIISVTVQ